LKNKKLTIPIIAVATFAIVGCGLLGRGVANEYRDPDFSRDDLITGRLIIGPVTSTFYNSEVRNPDSASWTHLMWSCMRSERSEIKLVPQERLHEALGSDYAILERGAEGNGKLEQQDLERIQEDFGDSGTFVSIVRFESDKISRTESETKDTTGAVTSVSLKTKREVMASVAIYDVTAAALVWSADILRSKTASKTFDTDSDRGGGWFGNIIYDIITGNDDEYPEKPPFIEVAEDIFDQIAKVLPENKS
jgi:hypothetical protein